MKVNDVWKLKVCPAGVKPLKTKWVEYNRNRGELKLAQEAAANKFLE